MNLMIIGSIIFFTGCRSEEAKQIVELPDQYAQKMTNEHTSTGMGRGWIEYDQIMKYDNIMVSVKVSDKMIKNTGWNDFTCRRLVASKDEDNSYVANYTRDAFINAFKASKHFKLVDKPAPKTLKLDFFIVQVVPGKPIQGGLSNLSTLSPIGFLLLPLKMGIKSASGSGGGAIAMETIITDSETNQILAVFASREKAATSLFSTKDFTSYGAVRSIVRIWSRDIVETLDQVREGEKDISVKDRVKGFEWID